MISPTDTFIMEEFIDKIYPTATLEALNNIRIYMRVLVLSDMCTSNTTKIVSWDILGTPK